MKKAVYTRPDKPLFIPVIRRHDTAPAELKQPEIVEVDTFTECHVTPAEVASRMVDYLGPVGDYLTLEPQAGTGALAKALLAAGHSRHELTMVERHIKLAGKLRDLGPVINRCFLEYAEEAKGEIEFPRVLMNPPFREVRKHMNAALSLLGRGGHAEPAVLVALVPITYKHDDAVDLEVLPPDTFALAKVNTKIVRFER